MACFCSPLPSSRFALRLVFCRPYGPARGLMRCLSYRVSLPRSLPRALRCARFCFVAPFRAHFEFCHLDKFDFSATLFHNWLSLCLDLIGSLIRSAAAVQYPRSAVNIAIPYYEQSQGQNEWAIICSRYCCCSHQSSRNNAFCCSSVAPGYCCCSHQCSTAAHTNAGCWLLEAGSWLLAWLADAAAKTCPLPITRAA